MNRRKWSIVIAIVCSALSLLGSLRAAEVPLAALVSDDLGLCIETHDLGKSYSQLADSPLLMKWSAHPLMRMIWQRRQPELSKAAQQIRTRLGLSPVELLREFAADETLFAVWPGSRVELPAGGILLIRSRHHERVRSTIQHVTTGGKPEPRSPDETVEIMDRRAQIYKLNLGAGKPSLLLVYIIGDEQRGSLALLASHRTAVDRLLLALQGQSVERALSEHPGYQSAIAPNTEQATLRVFIQPRAWDTLLLTSEEPRDERARRLRKLLQETWRACTAISLALDLHHDIKLQAHVGLDDAILPPSMRRLLATVQGTPTLPSRLPDHALAKVQLRCDLRGVLQELFLPDEQNPSLLPLPKDENWPVSAALLSSLGPDFQAGIVSTQSSNQDGAVDWPVSWIAKLGTQSPDRSNSTSPPAEAMLSLLRAWAQFQSYRQADVQATPTVETLTIHDQRFTQFRTRGGEGIIPWLLTAKHDSIWGGSSAAEIAQFITQNTSAAKQPPATPAPQQSLFIDLHELRRVLRESAAGSPQWQTLKRLSIVDAQRQWSTMIGLLDLADQVSADMHFAPSSVVARVKISAAKPTK